MTSIRLPASTSLTSWTERSWPIASGVSVSGNGTVSRSGSTGSVSGSGWPDADLDLARGVAVADDVDHGSSMMSWEPPRSIGTLRVCDSGSASGSSTRRMPSW